MKYIVTFEKFNLPLAEWIQLHEEEREEFSQNILDLINKSYSKIGGHYKIPDLESVIRNSDYDVWKGIDVDGDNELEAVTFSEKTPFGLKGAGMGQDGSRGGKIAAIVKTVTDLKEAGNYAEMSGEIVSMMLKAGVPYVNDAEKVLTVTGKEITWLGEHPNGDCPGTTGWYSRKVGNKEVIKMMMGIPRFNKNWNDE